MNRSLVRRLTVTVFCCNLLAVTWPGLYFFRMPEPFPFGMPMSMVWPVCWIIVSGITLLFMDSVEKRYEDE